MHGLFRNVGFSPGLMLFLDEISLFVNSPFELFGLNLVFFPKRNQQDSIAIVFLLVSINIPLEGDAVFDGHIDQVFLANWRLAAKLSNILFCESGG